MRSYRTSCYQGILILCLCLWFCRLSAVMFLISLALVHIVCTLPNPCLLFDHDFGLCLVLFAKINKTSEYLHLCPQLNADRILCSSMDAAGGKELCLALAAQGCFIGENQQQINMLTDQLAQFRASTPTTAVQPQLAPFIAHPEKYSGDPAGWKGWVQCSLHQG